MILVLLVTLSIILLILLCVCVLLVITNNDIGTNNRTINIIVNNNLVGDNNIDNMTVDTTTIVKHMHANITNNSFNMRCGSSIPSIIDMHTSNVVHRMIIFIIILPFIFECKQY